MNATTLIKQGYTYEMIQKLEQNKNLLEIMRKQSKGRLNIQTTPTLNQLQLEEMEYLIDTMQTAINHQDEQAFTFLQNKLNNLTIQESD